MVELPFRVGKHIRSIKRCTVKLVNSSEPYCSVASSATSSSLHLKSRKQGIHIFSAGFFTFKPLKEPELCYQKPRPQTHSKFTSDQKTSPLQPRLRPLLSIPKLPPLISLSPTLNPPSDQTNPPAVSASAMLERAGESRPDTFFFPSPPFGLPPNPFFPPPSILPPNPLLPSPPPFINIPPIPFFTPPPPPPIIPFFPFPPFPFPPPRPVFPGIPPANTMNEKSP